MHMADALISPLVGGAMWAASTGAAAYSIAKIKDGMDEKKIPLMGVMGAFVFAAQMINFTIPATGSSGHLGGGLLLAILLGPYAGFLTIASVLAIQALFFADGGLLAYGCNVFNIGFFSCFIAYPLVYRVLMGKGESAKRTASAVLLAAVVALQLGAFGVVMETFFSGKTELPLAVFLLFMQPIHLAVGIFEGLVTAAVAAYAWKVRPEIIDRAAAGENLSRIAVKKVVVFLAAAALVTALGLSWFASANPDGLEWSLLKTAGTSELETSGGFQQKLAALQAKMAFLPDYAFRSSGETDESAIEAVVAVGETSDTAVGGKANNARPAAGLGKSMAGVVGGGMTLFLAGLLGAGINLLKRKKIGNKQSIPDISN